MTETLLSEDITKSKEILNSLQLKHDHTLTSLTKQALAEIVIKLIYQSGTRGISVSQLKSELKRLTQVSFKQDDITESLNWLQREGSRIYRKNSKFFLSVSYKDQIAKAVEQNEELKHKVVSYWFGTTQTYQQSNGAKILLKWFETLLIDFFIDYSYDWIRDLMPKRRKADKKTPKVEALIDSSLINEDIQDEDKDWLKKQFVKFLESEREDDDRLLWNFGSSRFSATLLTARNFADEFSLTEFTDSTFILDTNILMILELEGYKKSDSLQLIEEVLTKLNIQPVYFNISREEYIRAIAPKRESTLAAFDKYHFEVFKETDCIFIQTALKRGCTQRSDFERFFDQIMDVPERFNVNLLLECLDYEELDKEIKDAEEDEQLKEKINAVYKRRNGNDKRDKPKKHDAGLFKGGQFVRKDKKGKAVILTRDGALREFSYENAVRDELPLAIGIDSFIQLLALDQGGVERSSDNFAPLFGKIVKASLFPEKDLFKPEDLHYLSNAKINIQSLTNEQIIEVAREINKLRYRGTSPDDIHIYIRRFVQQSTYFSEDKLEYVTVEKRRLESEVEDKDRKIIEYKNQLFESKVDKEYEKQKKASLINILFFILVAGVLFTIVYFSVSGTNDLPQNAKVGIQLIGNLLGNIVSYLVAFKNKIKFKSKATIREELKNKQD